MGVPRLLALEPVSDVFLQRLALVALGLATLRDHRDHIVEMAAASVDAPGSFLDRLVVALIDGALACSSASVARAFVGRWFIDFGCQSNPFQVLPWRGVRRVLDLFAIRGLRTNAKGRGSEMHLSPDEKHLGGWLAAHEGSDWCAPAEAVQQLIQERGVSVETLGPLCSNLASELSEWRLVRWPRMRADLEVHLIPDLAAMVIDYLQPPTLAKDQ